MSKIKLYTLLIIYILCCICIYYSPKTVTKNIKTKTTNEIKIIESIENKLVIEEEKPIGKLIIKKINLEKQLYEITSKKNNIEENVTILNGSIEPNKNNSIFFLAAHSGPGDIAFFNDLDKLNINDKILLEYKNSNYIYQVKDIWETKKDGNIEINKEVNNQLILTTCSKKDEHKQLILNCIKIES